jgi:hypothetical protein
MLVDSERESRYHDATLVPFMTHPQGDRGLVFSLWPFVTAVQSPISDREVLETRW